MKFNMIDYHTLLSETGVTTVYSGPLWADGIEGIAGMLKRRLEFDAISLSASQSVFSVFVEQMNNMLMYSAEKEELDVVTDTDIGAPKGTFVLGSEGKSYFIQTGNIMRNDSVALIKSRIDYLNTLDKQGLRKYYKEQIKVDNSNPESKGAGLGLIEIARRASSKIEYSFSPYKDGLTFFAMYVRIGGEN